jgi:hypothetical protein
MVSSSRNTLSLIMLTVSFQVLPILRLNAGEPEVTVAAIFARFGARQRMVETGRFEIAEEVTFPKGSMGNRMVLSPKRNSAEPPPLTTVTHPKTRFVSFSRDFLRYGYKGPTWSTQVQEFVEQSYTSIYNGKDSKSFFGNAYGEHPLGFVRKKNGAHADADDLRIQAVLRHFRPLHSSMGRLVSAESVLRAEVGAIGTHKCAIVDQRAPGGKESFWVDLDRDFIILRIQREYGAGHGFEQIDVSHVLDKDHGWVPSGWRGLVKRSSDNGKSMALAESFVAKVTSYQINAELDSQEFDISFPPNTWVEDQTHEEGYIVKEGGQKRMITSEERRRNPSYQSLLKTESGRAGLPVASNSLFVVILSSLIGLGLIILIWCIVRRRRRGSLLSN